MKLEILHGTLGEGEANMYNLQTTIMDKIFRAKNPLITASA